MGSKVRVAVAATVLAAAMGAGVCIGVAWADQPRMEAALSNLQDAKANLQAAEHNKGGHRLTAIGYIDSAISEVRAGMRDAD